VIQVLLNVETNKFMSRSGLVELKGFLYSKYNNGKDRAMYKLCRIIHKWFQVPPKHLFTVQAVKTKDKSKNKIHRTIPTQTTTPPPHPES
jgi:hypothetical protein